MLELFEIELFFICFIHIVAFIFSAYYIFYMLMLIKTSKLYLCEKHIKYRDKFGEKNIELANINSIDIMSNLLIINYNYKQKMYLRPIFFDKKGFYDELIKRLNITEVKRIFSIRRIYTKNKSPNTKETDEKNWTIINGMV